MGNTFRPQQFSLVRDYRKEEWFHITKFENYQLWRHKYTHQCVQVFRLYQLPTSEDLSIYQFRSKTHDIVKVFHLTTDHLNVVCQQNNYGQLLIQHIPKRLTQIQSMNKEETLTSLIAALRGFWILQNRFGIVEPIQEMIGFNEQGQTKIWHNKHYQINQPEKNQLQLHHSVFGKQISRPRKILEFYNSKVNDNFLPQYIKQQFDNPFLSHENAILIISNYAKAQNINLKKYFNFASTQPSNLSHSQLTPKYQPPQQLHHLKESIVSPVKHYHDISIYTPTSPVMKRIQSDVSLQKKPRQTSFSILSNQFSNQSPVSKIKFTNPNTDPRPISSFVRSIPKVTRVNFTFQDSFVGNFPSTQQYNTERENHDLRISNDYYSSAVYEKPKELSLASVPSIELMTNRIQNKVTHESKMTQTQTQLTIIYEQNNKKQQCQTQQTIPHQVCQLKIQSNIVISKEQTQPTKLQQMLNVQQRSLKRQSSKGSIPSVKSNVEIPEDVIKEIQISIENTQQKQRFNYQNQSLRASPYFVLPQNNLVGSIERFVSFGPSKLQNLKLNKISMDTDRYEDIGPLNQGSDSFQASHPHHRISDEIHLSTERVNKSILAEQKFDKEVNNMTEISPLIINNEKSLVFDHRYPLYSDRSIEKTHQVQKIEKNATSLEYVKQNIKTSIKDTESQINTQKYEITSQKRSNKHRKRSQIQQTQDFLDINFLQKSLQKKYSPKATVTLETAKEDEDILDIAKLDQGLQKFSKSQNSIDSSKRQLFASEQQVQSITPFVQPRFTFEKIVRITSIDTIQQQKTYEQARKYKNTTKIQPETRQYVKPAVSGRKRHTSNLYDEQQPEIYQKIEYNLDNNRSYNVKQGKAQKKWKNKLTQLEDRYEKYVRTKQRGEHQASSIVKHTSQYYQRPQYRYSYNTRQQAKKHPEPALQSNTSKLKKSDISYKELRSILWN